MSGAKTAKKDHDIAYDEHTTGTSVSIETMAQLGAVLEELSDKGMGNALSYSMGSAYTVAGEDPARMSPGPGIIYIDAGYFAPEDFHGIVERIHDHGLRCGLRLPQIWREQAERWGSEQSRELAAAGFDCWLFRNMESLLFFHEEGLLTAAGSYALDHSIYVTNRAAGAELVSMLPDEGVRLCSMTFPLEWNVHEMRDLLQYPNINMELVVYGRAPMMVTAQCLRKTATGCDHVPETVFLTDRKGARMPVRNCCRFCCNTIYNAVPTVLYDLPELAQPEGMGGIIKRYEFTTETAAEVRQTLQGQLPAHGAYTRGHFRKSVL